MPSQCSTFDSHWESTNPFEGGKVSQSLSHLLYRLVRFGKKLLKSLPKILGGRKSFPFNFNS